MAKKLLDCEISQKLDAKVHYLAPALLSSFLYILLITCDIALVYRHYRDENPVWSWVTLFIIYIPVLVSYILIVTDWQLWPHLQGCGRDNAKWFITRTMQHLLFIFWALWRYAERIFWSIEAVRSQNAEDFQEAISYVCAKRTVELYMSLQAFLHCLPQMLLQLYTLMRRDNVDMDRQTADVQFFSFILNLIKLSVTVAHYQRFKSQKAAGKDYPWNKFNVKPAPPEKEATPEPEPVPSPPADENISRLSRLSERRRSSDIYLEPELRELTATDISQTTSSVTDGQTRPALQQFNIRRIDYIEGLPEDDFVGLTVATVWWFCFLLARILAISAFAYFYPGHCVWLIAVHFIVVILILCYDAKTDALTRSKALFFIFLGLIYIFCIIEFKIRFKKTKYVYWAFFAVVFAENFAMCIVWWFLNVEDLENTYWFRYIFYMVNMCSITSLSAMVLYLNINKPKKVIVGRVIRNN